MNDAPIDNVLLELSTDTPLPQPSPGFRDSIWQRVGEIVEARDRRRKNLLSLAIAIVGLATGIGTASSPALAGRNDFRHLDGSDLAPSALLHVTK